MVRRVVTSSFAVAFVLPTVMSELCAFASWTTVSNAFTRWKRVYTDGLNRAEAMLSTGGFVCIAWTLAGITRNARMAAGCLRTRASQRM
jgi:hypothetical protein